MKRCYLAEFAPEHLAECDGRLQRAHVISRMRLKREFPHGAYFIVLGACEARSFSSAVCARGTRSCEVKHPTTVHALGRNGAMYGLESNTFLYTVSLAKILKDERDMVDGCVRHHQLLDNARFYVAEWPASVQEFADELGLGWVLERQAA